MGNFCAREKIAGSGGLCKSMRCSIHRRDLDHNISLDGSTLRISAELKILYLVAYDFERRFKIDLFLDRLKTLEILT